MTLTSLMQDAEWPRPVTSRGQREAERSMTVTLLSRAIAWEAERSMTVTPRAGERMNALHAERLVPVTHCGKNLWTSQLMLP